MDASNFAYNYLLITTASQLIANRATLDDGVAEWLMPSGQYSLSSIDIRATTPTLRFKFRLDPIQVLQSALQVYVEWDMRIASAEKFSALRIPGLQLAVQNEAT
jgi:hypothetical protein